MTKADIKRMISARKNNILNYLFHCYSNFTIISLVVSNNNSCYREGITDTIIDHCIGHGF